MTILKYVPLAEVRLAFRVYGPWWVIIYAYLASYVSLNEVGEYENVIPIVISILIHSGLYISTKWSVKCRLLFNMHKVKSFSVATHAYYDIVYFVYKDVHEKMYIVKDCIRLYLNEYLGIFEKSVLPINKSISYYTSSVGLSTDSVSKESVCPMDIPIPEFWDLLKEHVIEPFFVFQLFCVLLWLLDEYWNYALMTLIMLLLLECQVVNRRLSDLRELSLVKPEIVSMFVYRDSKWISIKSNLVFPGDIVGLSTCSTVPCDIALLRNSTGLVNEENLTGESVPVLKHALVEDSRLLDIDSTDRNFILFAGSTIIAVKEGQKVAATKCLIGFVLRTGFETAQGELVVSILNSEKRVSASSREAYMFILLLVGVALVAAAYVVYDGIYISGRSRFKLFLSVSHILTSVIPPEFPITLSLTVTLSLAQLMRHKIFCTEPFRIPSAGKVTHCCFDKTGTLTSSEMVFNALHHISSNPFVAKNILFNCHTLVEINHKLIGDPIEEAAVEWAGKNGAKKFRNIAHFPFDSVLQRMSSLVKDGTSDDVLMMKGSPESVRSCLSVVPADYDENCAALVSTGLRVLALAVKRPLENGMDRKSAESDCVFAGFVSFTYTIKPGTIRAITSLQAAGIRCVIITGDHLLTAFHVAKVVGIAGRSLDVSRSGLPADFSDVSIFARASPLDKKKIVEVLNKEEKVCLYCGDGTNDVSALKEATVGVSIRSSPGTTNTAASIASPFVYREHSIRCVPILIRSGRATLALVMQMYKTLAVNSLVTAFIFTYGVKLGDTQTVIESLLMSCLSFILSRPQGGAPQDIDKRAPIVSVFAWSVVGSICMQSVLHVFLIWIGQSHFTHVVYDEKFSPSAQNTFMFIQLFASHLTTCVVNYEGLPSLPSLRSSLLAKKSVLVIFALLFLLTTQIVFEINEIFELVNIDVVRLSWLVAIHIFGGWIIAHGIRFGIERS